MRFYEHFACAYGTIWLLLMAVAIVTQSHINAGMFGLVGFPIIALVYAFIRRASDSAGRGNEAYLRHRISYLEGQLTMLRGGDHSAEPFDDRDGFPWNADR